MAREAVISVRRLVNRFGAVTIHDGLDLDLFRGEVLGIVGGSGTGKSVLLRSIIGLRQPASGSVTVLGTPLADATEDELRGLERRWGVMFQDGALFSALTVRQNVEVPLRERAALPEAMRGALARMKIGLVGLPPRAGDLMPAELSGGMRKRAGLARALALDPEILLLDEPTAGLDPIAATEFDDLLRSLQKALNLSVFLVTHDLDTLHATCDRIAVLAEKRVLVTGPIAELRDYDHPWVRSYFNGPRARAAEAAPI
jgi:phospholipid/cholesterol/gamma-HCH transport system ATP-binding protein